MNERTVGGDDCGANQQSSPYKLNTQAREQHREVS